jgi:DNA-binding Lrp family transcriptional regulator
MFVLLALGQSKIRIMAQPSNRLRKKAAPAALDRIDFDILAALQKDARLSNKELAASVGLAASSCLVRVRRLRKEGVLRAFHAELDPRAVGVGLQALVRARLRRHDRKLYASLRKYLLAQREVVALYYLAGEEDFVLHVAVRDTDHLRDLVVDRIATRIEVGHLVTSILFEHVRTAGLPILAPEVG